MSTDLTFLRRRVKPAATAPAATPQVAAPTSPIAVTDSDTTLTAENPAISLTPYASGIGTLHITGADAALVETQDGASHDLFRGAAPTFGNRPLAERSEQNTITVGLRHIRQLRRIGATGHDMTITTHAGVTVRVAGHADLGIHVVAGHLELRRDTPSADLTTTYAFGAPA